MKQYVWKCTYDKGPSYADVHFAVVAPDVVEAAAAAMKAAEGEGEVVAIVRDLEAAGGRDGSVAVSSASRFRRSISR